MIDKLTNQILNFIVIELKKDENQKLIQNHIIDPTIYFILEKITPYIIIFSIIFILILLLAICILILLLKH